MDIIDTLRAHVAQERTLILVLMIIQTGILHIGMKHARNMQKLSSYRAKKTKHNVQGASRT